jgi:GDP-L-fucose synthase
MQSTNLPMSFIWPLSVHFQPSLPNLNCTDSRRFLFYQVGGLFMHLKYKVSMLRDNILINDNVLHTSYLTGVQKVISCLSTCVFPDGIEPPLREDKIHLGPPHHSNFGYAHAKRLVDVANRAYKEQYGLDYTAAIPTNIYGPHDN